MRLVRAFHLLKVSIPLRRALISAGDVERVSINTFSPPLAGVIYLSVPFWYDREKPLRQKTIRSYYGSDSEDVWGVI